MLRVQGSQYPSSVFQRTKAALGIRICPVLFLFTSPTIGFSVLEQSQRLEHNQGGKQGLGVQIMRIDRPKWRLTREEIVILRRI